MSTTETSAKDEAAIKAVIAAFAEAWNTKDAEPLAKLFAEDSDFVDVIGRWFKGRTEIKQAHT
ncbi:MAG: SgcJ/EcaC family oxidoreductase [Nostoc sp.]|uniref:YybH family protein n=1 Tax=Nostoc sp. TaxID=1180 RepID=UPI002FFB8D8C